MFPQVPLLVLISSSFIPLRALIVALTGKAAQCPFIHEDLGMELLACVNDFTLAPGALP